MALAPNVKRPRVQGQWSHRHACWVWYVQSQYPGRIFFLWSDALYFAEYAAEPRHSAPHLYPEELAS